MTRRTGAPSVRYVGEDTVQRLLPPSEIWRCVVHAILERTLVPAFSANARHAGINLGVKGGFVDEELFGIKIRVGQEGRYQTLVWAADGYDTTIVESAYLTYLRTAALLLVPFALQAPRGARVLVAGAGRLGSACLALAPEALPEPRLYVWSPSGTGPRVTWPGLRPASVTRLGLQDLRETEIDLLITATSASDPLPLGELRPHHLAVGGAVRPERRELPSAMLAGDWTFLADNPARAALDCGDLRLRPEVTVGFLDEARQRPSNTAAFVCGAAPVDVALAQAVALRTANTSMGVITLHD